MDNSVLQKLLHGHVLMQNNHNKFCQMFMPPTHINTTDGNKPVTSIPKPLMKTYLEFHAKRIQQSMKFYLPEGTAENTLTGNEFKKLSQDLKMFLPFRSTFIQQECEIGITESEDTERLWNYMNTTEDKDYTKEDLKNIEETLDGEHAVANVYLEDCGFSDDEEQPMFKGNLSIWFKNDKVFFFDPNDYYFSYRNDDLAYTFWLPEQSAFYPYTDTRSDVDGGLYNSPSLNTFVSTIINIHTQLVLMLSYPQIAHKQDVLGITPANATRVPFSTRFTASEFLRKPKYEHKVLKLDLFGVGDTNGNSGTGESGSRAFHAVRKHIRQYSDGKISFVKAHFRGSKDVGLVTKDYEIVNRSK